MNVLQHLQHISTCQWIKTRLFVHIEITGEFGCSSPKRLCIICGMICFILESQMLLVTPLFAGKTTVILGSGLGFVQLVPELNSTNICKKSLILLAKTPISRQPMTCRFITFQVFDTSFRNCRVQTAFFGIPSIIWLVTFIRVMNLESNNIGTSRCCWVHSHILIAI